MTSKLAIVLGFLLAAGAIVYVTMHKDTTLLPQTTVEASAPRTPAEVTSINLVFATEERAWLEAALESFRKKRPDVQVTLTGKGSLDAAQAILEGQLKPVLFSPADSMVLELLAHDYETKYQKQLFAGDEDAPQPLLLTPLVFVVWEDRAEALLKKSQSLGFRAVHDAVTSPRGWLAAGGKAEWGFVKLGHTDPTRSNSGLQSLYLMTLEYWNKRTSVAMGDLLDENYQKFVAETERGVPRLEASTGTFMDDMVRFGPSRYDISLVYENLAIAQLENAQGRWGALRVYYPSTTLWSDHPIALLGADWVSPAQRDAARALIAHLRSRDVQVRALASGFRPAEPSVPLRTNDPQNPFVRLAPYGLKVELPEAAQTPDGAVLRNLLMMWTRVVRPR
jgi:ABC-type Fe3+ transport system substrate-binding protein